MLSLTLGTLVIANDPSDGLWLDEDGLSWPEKRWSRTSASSRWTHGSVQTNARLEQTAVSATVYAQGATHAALRAKQAELEAAAFEWSFDLTITEDGQAVTYAADCADVTWSDADSGMAGAHLARAVLTIPVHPVGV